MTIKMNCIERRKVAKKVRYGSKKYSLEHTEKEINTKSITIKTEKSSIGNSRESLMSSLFYCTFSDAFLDSIVNIVSKLRN